MRKTECALASPLNMDLADGQSTFWNLCLPSSNESRTQARSSPDQGNRHVFRPEKSIGKAHRNLILFCLNYH